MVKNNFLICLTGLPASGKTTFANQLKDIIEKRINNFKVKVVDPDKIRGNLTPHEFNYNNEQIIRKKNLEDIQNGLKQGYIVISDDLNYYTSMRHDLKEIAENLGLK
ncbi:MAG: adenylyl-sulfate kinase, partial [Promethearchaeota archaeon]